MKNLSYLIIACCLAVFIFIAIDISNYKDNVNPYSSDKPYSSNNTSSKSDKNSFINPLGKNINERIKTPDGFSRDIFDDSSFEAFLRNYPLKEDGSDVLLHNKKLKSNQNAHIAVFDFPIENKDLQQCADSVMMAYAEYLYKEKRYDEIKFHFVSGFLCEYSKWKEGYRVLVIGNNVNYVKTKSFDDSYETFRSYLNMVFNYASTLSLGKESTVIDSKDINIGDIFLTPGSPGHVVMVVDICKNDKGEKAFLLAQGFMPAQDFHILKNPNSKTNPWYYEKDISYPFKTPEYTFAESSLKRPVYLNQ